MNKIKISKETEKSDVIYTKKDISHLDEKQIAEKKKKEKQTIEDTKRMRKYHKKTRTRQRYGIWRKPKRSNVGQTTLYPWIENYSWFCPELNPTLDNRQRIIKDFQKLEEAGKIENLIFKYCPSTFNIEEKRYYYDNDEFRIVEPNIANTVEFEMDSNIFNYNIFDIEINKI